MSEETPLKVSEIDWCHLIDPPCPYRIGSTCGIEEHLKGFRSRAGKTREAKRLLEDAEENPEGFKRICEKGSQRTW